MNCFYYTNFGENSMNAPKVFKRLTALMLLVSLCSALLLIDNTKAQASGRNTATTTTPVEKLSPELRQLIQSGQGSARVKVIVQSAASPSLTSGGLLGGLLGGLVQTVGGVVQGVLSALNITLLDVRADSVNVLAADPSISYISLDSQVRTFGHVTNTTGTQQSRAQKTALGLNYSLDGSNVSIAILDSGIDVTHKSFTSQSGKVTFSKDFTGENRTDDPYGHGTHVAAVAAGAGTATNGSYEGIASAANLVNLRVINSQGIGTVSGVLKALDWIATNRQSYNIRVVNMSLGTPAVSSYKDDPVCQAVRKLVNAGVVVVAAAGNNGKTSAGKVYGSIHCPGNEPSAITVGASNTYGSDPRRFSDDLQLARSNTKLFD
jgi:serine protease AprX